jgi:hypothetical protein
MYLLTIVTFIINLLKLPKNFFLKKCLLNSKLILRNRRNFYILLLKKSPCTKESVNCITINNVQYNDPRDIANKFNEFFSNVALKIVSEIPPTDRPPDPDPEANNDDVSLFSLSNIPVTASEVIETINSFEPKKSTDFDGLSMFLSLNLLLLYLRP